MYKFIMIHHIITMLYIYSSYALHIKKTEYCPQHLFGVSLQASLVFGCLGLMEAEGGDGSSLVSASFDCLIGGTASRALVKMSEVIVRTRCTKWVLFQTRFVYGVIELPVFFWGGSCSHETSPTNRIFAIGSDFPQYF